MLLLEYPHERMNTQVIFGSVSISRTLQRARLYDKLFQSTSFAHIFSMLIGPILISTAHGIIMGAWRTP
ncbi:hypothetical protein BDN70DRAFT_703897 [Pholiota conissans]|uniref:Uncharacterized protein n=1 Tax=Pholiota conissans TaxID=109636 RepID=A0A9P5Z322_9AGAR|nr:hypothetical protein BDN70DRAFT_703897 [Pholiota conissans]